MLSSLAGSGRIARACVLKALSGQLLLCLEGNTFGVSFKLGRTPAKQQGPGSQRQPRPSLAYGDQRARGEKGKRCFVEQRRIGAVLCSPRRVFLSGMELSEARFEPWVRWAVGSELPTWLWGFAGASVQNAFSCRFLYIHEWEHVWSGIQPQETTSKAAGPREPEAAPTLFGLWSPDG